MTKKVLKINAHLPAIPDWLKINNAITFPLPLKSAKELASKLLEVKEDIEVQLKFASGKEPTLEIKYEMNKATEK